jgi:hypothetical protein
MSKFIETDELGASFFLGLFGADVGPGKQYRELSKNAFEAIVEQMQKHRNGIEFVGRVEQYIDPYTREYGGYGAKKLGLCDNGIGMPQKIMANLKLIFSRNKFQSLHGNYGIGARAATLKFNPEGVEWRSWQDGKGYTCTLSWYPDQKKFGFYDYDLGNGVVMNVVPIEPPYFTEEECALMKPPMIKDHGTFVVLHGDDPSADTTLMPLALREELGFDARSKEHTAFWLTYIYNRQYFTLPDNVEFRLFTEPVGEKTEKKSGKSRDPFKSGGQLRIVRGTKYILDRFAVKSGTAQITGAKVMWWIYPDADTVLDPNDIDPETNKPYGINNETGKPFTVGLLRKRKARVWYPWFTGSDNHAIVAAAFDGEQFDLFTKVDALRMLQKFGVFAGQTNVSIIVEPDADQDARSNMNRTSLLIGEDSRPLPWDRWGSEFARRMNEVAPELLDYIEDKLGHTDFESELAKLIAEMNDDFRVQSVGKRPTSTKAGDDIDPNGITKKRGKRVRPDPTKTPVKRPEPDPEREIRHRASPNGRTKYRPIHIGAAARMQLENQPHPAVKLVTEQEHPTFRGRAAEYVQETTEKYPSGIVFINKDFDVLQKLIEETLTANFGEDEEKRAAARPRVEHWVELVYSVQIVFAVMTYRHSYKLGHGADWSEEDARKLVEPEALTTVALARPGMRAEIKRRINSDQRLRLLMMEAEAQAESMAS